MALYADIIIDISLEKLDRTFQYLVPEELEQDIGIGMPIEVPFGKGSRRITGYVVNLPPNLPLILRKLNLYLILRRMGYRSRRS